KETTLLTFKDITMDVGRHIVAVSGQNVVLTLKEFELLKMFMENPEQVFTRDHILSAVWGMDYVGESRTVDVHVGTLRTKLESAGAYIHTVRGVGYKMEENNEQ
ncbi:MAG: response regulator transcription factor, partial [Lachnospiraceae bacterium]|nr:response regulator transcription factor [Lachnospiraceae bacterium]